MLEKIQALSVKGDVYIRYSPGYIVEWAVVVRNVNVHAVGDTLDQALDSAIKMIKEMEL